MTWRRRCSTGHGRETRRYSVVRGIFIWWMHGRVGPSATKFWYENMKEVFVAPEIRRRNLTNE